MSLFHLRRHQEGTGSTPFFFFHALWASLLDTLLTASFMKQSQSLLTSISTHTQMTQADTENSNLVSQQHLLYLPPLGIPKAPWTSPGAMVRIWFSISLNSWVPTQFCSHKTQKACLSALLLPSSSSIYQLLLLIFPLLLGLHPGPQQLLAVTWATGPVFSASIL